MKIYMLSKDLSVRIRRKIGKTQKGGPTTKVKTDTAKDPGQLVVLITGSSRGLGFAAARSFLEKGASVVINGTDEKKLAEALQELRSKFKNVEAVRADVSKPDEAKRLVVQTVECFGRLDVLINNAAIAGSYKKRIWEVEDEEWKRLIDINVHGAFFMSRQAARHALSSRRPLRIVNVSSEIVTYDGATECGPYHVSKAALEALSSSYGWDGDDERLITSLSVRFGAMKTDMTKPFFSFAEHTVLPEPESCTSVLIYAATQPVESVKPKAIRATVFEKDPAAETALGNSLSEVVPAPFFPTNYDPKFSAFKTEDSGAYMHFLQNPYRPFSAVKSALNEAIQRGSFYEYPDPEYTDLRRVLADAAGLKPENVVFGGGSSDILGTIARTFLEFNDGVVTTDPAWGGAIRYFAMSGARMRAAPHLGSLKQRSIKPDLSGLLGRLDRRHRLIYLVNPCNPTGVCLDPAEMDRFLGSLPDYVTVVVDEAYMEFTDPEYRSCIAPKIPSYAANVILLRTFSKFYALSGFRIGYAYARPEVAQWLVRSQSHFNVTSCAASAALAAMCDKESIARTYENNRLERRRIAEALEKLGISHQPSQTNFVLYDCPTDREKMRNALIERGIFLPNVDGLVGGNRALFPVGFPQHNSIVLDFLSRH